MPPAANRDVFVILYDLKVKNRSSALHTLSQIILYEELSQSKNQYKLYLVNAAETDNNLKHKGILKKDALIDAGSLIENILNVQQGKSDFLEALEVAVDELKEWFQKSGVATLQIVFITDLDTFESVIPSEQLISNISSMSIFLYIIGPEIFPPKTIMCHDDISKWMKTFEANKLKGNLEVASSIVKSTPYSVICHYSLGMHLFHSYKFCNGKQAWQVPLSFGSILHLQVSTMKYCEAGMPFRLKNNLITERNQKWVYVDDPEKCIDIRDTVKGIVKHGKFVKIEDDARFKSYGPRSFQILLITEAKNVPEHSFQNENSYIVLPNQQQSEEYLQFINTFIDQLAEENKYIIARRVYNKDYNPMFVVLIPRWVHSKF
ncbi:hypothetical protein ABEB36_002125 [Hypothenemus hampei]|uniref:Ku domain-containing protein n=1 Tax=Hypothenemus hampei TaxID=57062 RepID=A0ABD1F4L9_HYPHA